MRDISKSLAISFERRYLFIPEMFVAKMVLSQVTYFG
jgi:hypothetical protein